jgi:hypothetical protein
MNWFFFLFLMIYSLSGDFDDVPWGSRNTAYIVAVIGAAPFVLRLHRHARLGHAIVARRNGIGIAGIDLSVFGGTAKIGREAESPGAC